MGKKAICLCLAFVMMLGLAGCGPKEPETPPEAKETYKIGIMTGTVSQGEEEFRAAQNMAEKYGDKIVTATYPDLSLIHIFVLTARTSSLCLPKKKQEELFLTLERTT